MALAVSLYPGVLCRVPSRIVSCCDLILLLTKLWGEIGRELIAKTQETVPPQPAIMGNVFRGGMACYCEIANTTNKKLSLSYDMTPDKAMITPSTDLSVAVRPDIIQPSATIVQVFT